LLFIAAPLRRNHFISKTIGSFLQDGDNILGLEVCLATKGKATPTIRTSITIKRRSEKYKARGE
jgi:hypothetical protein